MPGEPVGLEFREETAELGTRTIRPVSSPTARPGENTNRDLWGLPHANAPQLALGARTPPSRRRRQRSRTGADGAANVHGTTVGHMASRAGRDPGGDWTAAVALMF